MRKTTVTGKLAAGLIVMVILFAAIGGGAAWLEQRSSRKALSQDLTTAEESSVERVENTVFLNDRDYVYDHRIESFLFIGTDGSGSRTDEKYEGSMADFLLLMVLDYTDDSCGCLQIDRNTITDVYMLDDADEMFSSREMQICVANMYGTNPDAGAGNTVEAVRNLLGELPAIDGYYVMNMGDIGKLNSAVGGVEVTVQDDMTAADPGLTAGAKITLNDRQAESFVRARMSLADSKNESRMGRQTQYMTGLFEKVRTHTLENPGYGLELFDTLRNCAVTNMTGKDFSRIARMLLKGRDKGILRLKGQTKVGRVLDDGQEHEEFYPDPASVLSTMTELFTLIPEEDKPVEEE